MGREEPRHRNAFVGSGESFVQARDVSGGIRFHPLLPGQPELLRDRDQPRLAPGAAGPLPRPLRRPFICVGSGQN
ncbi:hypothetical protein ACWEFJ_21355 [Actinosynnema sp. NPDC004786]